MTAQHGEAGIPVESGPDSTTEPRAFFAAQLRTLLEHDDRLLSTIAKTAGLASENGGRRLSAWKRGDGVPHKWVICQRLVAVLLEHVGAKLPVGDPIRRLKNWESWYKAAERSPGTPPPLDGEVPAPIVGIPVGDLRDEMAFDYGVYPTIVLDEAESPLVGYWPRPHDVELAKTVGQWGDRRDLLLVLGGPASGKTRTCWQMVRALPAGWRLWHPVGPEALLDGLERLAPYTVVWLNELQRYLVDERVANVLREYLRGPGPGPILLLATLTGDRYGELTAESDSSVTELLRSRTSFRVPDRFSDEELDEFRASDVQDSRLRLVASAQTACVTQFLAGQLEVLRRLDNASRIARDLLTAAVDARRLGIEIALPDEMLLAALPGYVEPEVWQQLPADWSGPALADLARPCNGLPGLLAFSSAAGSAPAGRVVSAHVYERLEPERRSAIVPGSFWAAAGELPDRDALAALAREAHSRGYLRIAVTAADRAARLGSSASALLLAQMADRRDVGAAAAWMEVAGRTGEVSAWHPLAHDAIEAGSPDRTWLRNLVEYANGRLMSDVMPLLRDAGALEEAVEWLAPAAQAGHPDAMHATLRLYEALDRPDQATHWLLERLARVGDVFDRVRWADALATAGRSADADAEYRIAAETGHRGGMLGLATLARTRGEDAVADDWTRRAHTASGKWGRRQIRENLVTAGRLELATEFGWSPPEEALEPRAPLVWPMTDAARAEELIEQGRADEGEALLRELAEAGNTAGANALRRHLSARSRIGELVPLWRQLAHQGVIRRISLIRVLEEAGEYAEVEEILINDIRAGNRNLQSLAVAIGNHRGPATRQRLERYGLEPDGRIAEPWEFPPAPRDR